MQETHLVVVRELDTMVCISMKRSLAPLAVALLLVPVLAWAATGLAPETKTSTVLIANYSTKGQFIGWGSGFFVDEGIVVTNRHVIETGDWYRVYATGSDESVDMQCYRDITKSDVKINLEDDVAYMRAYLPCAHGTLLFAEDPQIGDPLWIIGYPYKNSVEESLRLTVSSGSMVEETWQGWLGTDAYLDLGNSGGPVVNEAGVAGVAVAKGVDEEGAYVVGYFIPSSVILNGLLYANDSRFGYTPQSAISSRRSSSSRSSSSSSLSSRPSVSSVSSSSRSAQSSSRPHVAPPTSPLQVRACLRATRLAQHSPLVMQRLNERLYRRFGFRCA